jgi:hypothetical protein
MHAIGSRSRWLELALAFGLGVAAALATGCGSSSVIEGELSENARKTVLQKRVDVKKTPAGRQESRSLGPRGRDRRP